MRTEYCGNTDTRFLDQTVTLFGWAHRRRDHGGVIFIDLRDREGLVQVVCDPDRADTFKIADSVRNEFVLRVSGKVRRRPEGTVNATLKSGHIDVLAHELEILNPTATPPFMIGEEDLRAGRQREFSQIDIETSFLGEREIQYLMEGLVRHVFKKVLDVDLPPFPRLTYAEATSKYGSDKPDLRVKLELTELTDVVKDAGFKVFKSAAQLADGRVAALRIPGGNEQFTRKELDDLAPFVAIYGAKSLAYIRVNDPSKLNEEGLQSPIVKFLSPEILGRIIERTGAAAGDLLFFGADPRKGVNDALRALPQKIGHEKGHPQPRPPPPPRRPLPAYPSPQ